ncbi:hypothetical protein GE21DRAFT_1043915 [Neurospora crassa]|nr:hypothetical protein GE21DRAFT_1043915 [Neurospora crassa]
MERHPTASYPPKPPRASTCPECLQGVCCVTTYKMHLCVYRDDHTYQANMDPVLCRMCAHQTRKFGKYARQALGPPGNPVARMSTLQLAKQGRGEAAGRQKGIAYTSCNSGQKRSVQRAQVTSSISILQVSSRRFENRRNRSGTRQIPPFERPEYRGFIAVVAELILPKVSLPRQNLEYLELSETSQRGRQDW